MNYLPTITSRFGLVAMTIAVLLPVKFAASHPAAFTIGQVMQAPFPSDLRAAPRGNSVAWVFDAKGCRNIWIASSGDPAKARPVTAYTQDDGFDIGELAWSADARLIAYTRGQSLDDDAPTNVTGSPDGPSPREVWLIAASGGTARKIGSGHSASFSPDGSRLVFTDNGRIWTAPVNEESATQSLVIDSGAVSSLVWAPDGKRLAFVSQRGSHSLVGVYDFITKTIAWMSPSLDNDSSVAFSPSGSQVAFIRAPSEERPLFAPRRSGQPWSIWIADVATGAGRRVWIADGGIGSVFHPTLSSENLFWASHDQLVFPWEKTGWLHLYAMSAQNGIARALTSGNFEVVNAVLSQDHQHVFYSSSQDTIDKFHIWSVDPDRHEPAKRLGPPQAIEDFPQSGSDGAIFALQSDATKPLEPVELVGGKWVPLAPHAFPSTFPSSKLVTPQAVTFSAKDGQTVHGQLFIPHDAGAASPHPAILFFHGGPYRQMLVGFNSMGAYSWMYALNEYFASRGYVVLSVNYRGSIGYGLDYREATDFGPTGGSELNDLLGAVTFLQARKDIDPHRMGIWGGSYGGLMTALGLARASDAIVAGVDYAGVYNWATFLSEIGAPADGDDAKRRAFDSSPARTIDQWRSPVLVVQADDDRSVPYPQSSALIDALRSHHVEHDVLVLPNEIHDLARYASWMTFFTATDDYLASHLEKTPPTPGR